MNDLLHSFPGQERNEAVFVFARPYFIAFLPTVLIFLIVFAFSLGLQYAISSGILGVFSEFQINLATVVLGAFQLLVLIVFFVALLDFYFDIVVVTDRRLVDIDQNLLFSRRISELALEDVEDATSVVSGIFPTIFNYGTVLIQTAAKEENFRMDNILFPREVAALVINLSEQAKKNIEEGQRQPETEMLAVIDNHPVHSMDELAALGAILPQDMRRVSRRNPNA